MSLPIQNNPKVITARLASPKDDADTRKGPADLVQKVVSTVTKMIAKLVFNHAKNDAINDLNNAGDKITGGFGNAMGKGETKPINTKETSS